MSSKQAAILVVDDERSVVDLLSEDLAEEGYNCATASTGEKALERLSKDSFDAMLLDLKLPGISGMDVLKEAKSNYPETTVIIITGAGDVETVVEAMKVGAIDYIMKPFELERVNSSIKIALKIKPFEVDKASKKSAGEGEEDWTHCLDNMARGVEARLDSMLNRAISETIVEKTSAIARILDIPDDYVEKWAEARRRQVVQFISTMDALQKELEQNPESKAMILPYLAKN